MAAEALFLFADLAGFTALTEAHGDVDAADVAARLYELATCCVAGTTRVVKTIGDAVMIAAPDPREGVRTALRLVAAVHAEPRFPLLRAGLHAGEAVARGDDYFGAAVNLAARVAAHARAGQTLCTAAVAELARAAQLARVTPIGAVSFKNVAQPVELFELTAVDLEDCCVDPVCRMKVAPAGAAARVELGGAVFYFCSTECAARFRAAPDGYLASRRTST